MWLLEEAGPLLSFHGHHAYWVTIHLLRVSNPSTASMPRHPHVNHRYETLLASTKHLLQESFELHCDQS